MKAEYTLIALMVLSSLGVFLGGNLRVGLHDHEAPHKLEPRRAARSHTPEVQVLRTSKKSQKLQAAESTITDDREGPAHTTEGQEMRVRTTPSMGIWKHLEGFNPESLSEEIRTSKSAGQTGSEGSRIEKQTADYLEPGEWHRLPAVDPGAPIMNSGGGLPPWLDSKTGTLFRTVEAFNDRQPLNVDRFPIPPRNTKKPPPTLLVLYVHNRPAFLEATISALSQVEGINETTLIVSHDGYFPKVHALVQSIRFCRVKQIYCPFSPHLHPGRFPGLSPNDCIGKKGKNASQTENTQGNACVGFADPFGNFRNHRIVSLKHHWWWLMNTVWKGRIEETRGHTGYIAFFEEDHYLHPNAYRTLQALLRAKTALCPECHAVQLGPYRHLAMEEGRRGGEALIAEAMGNLCYAFNASTWSALLSNQEAFCTFNDYNWDWSIRSTVYPKMRQKLIVALRGPWRSVTHFGSCGAHVVRTAPFSNDCSNVPGSHVHVPKMRELDAHVNLPKPWKLLDRTYPLPVGTGFGGWSDRRDQQLCRDIGALSPYDEVANPSRSDQLPRPSTPGSREGGRSSQQIAGSSWGTAAAAV